MSSKPQRKYSSPRQVDRRRRILNVAATHLVSHGLDSLSMNSLAAASEVSVKTLYNLFGSRDELLLKAGTQSLTHLEESETILSVEPGIPRLYAFVVATMQDFIAAPKYAHAVISTLAKADLSETLADRHMGVVRRYAESSLKIAAENNELRPGVDVRRLATHISADQWGAVLLWIKGLLDVSALPDHVALSHYMTLLPITTGVRRAQMEREYEQLLIETALVVTGA